MTYEEAIQFWFGRVNYEQKSPQVGDFKLERMRQLLALLGNPHQPALQLPPEKLPASDHHDQCKRDRARR